MGRDSLQRDENMHGGRSEKLTLIIPISGTESNVVDLGNPKSRRDIQSFHIYCPTTTGVITIEVSGDAGATWVGLKIGGSTPSVTNGFCNIMDVEPSWDLMRIKSGSAEAAARSFTVATVV